LNVEIVSRGKGDSAVAAAAYQSRSRLVDERTGEVHDYSRNAGELLFAGIYAPKDAPAWAHDRARLWNHVEAFERRKDAQLARRFIIALPHELTPEQNRYAVQDWVRDNFTRKGWIADVAIHAPGAGGDNRNFHAHVLVVMRKLDGQELAAKKERAATVADRKDELEALRESWEKTGNRHLERHGFEPTLDRRSFADRGIEQAATVHLGKAATALERDGMPTERGDLNREIVAENALLRAVEAGQRLAGGPGMEIRAAAGGASQAPEIVRTAAEIEQTAADAAGRMAKALGDTLSRIAKPLEGIAEALGDMLSPTPAPTPEQAEGIERAADEAAEARARAAPQQAWNAARGRDIDENVRQQQNEQTQRYSRFGVIRSVEQPREQGQEQEIDREK
jgi:MobA/MobL family